MVVEVLGFLGAFLIVLAYIPQIEHIVREHCSGGVSFRAWLWWLVATIFILIYALSTQDMVFIILQVVNLVAIIAILLLIRTYRPRVCHSKESEFKKKRKK